MEPVRTIFFGTPEYAARLLRAAATWPQIQIVRVITEPAKPSGRGRRVVDSPVKQAVQELGLEVVEPKDQHDLIAAAKTADAQLGLLLAFGRILPPAVIQSFHYGILNIHPSLLPKYRGPAPVFWPILNGDAETGVSVMQINDGCDTGPLLSQRPTKIKTTDTTETLTDRLVDRGIKLLAEALPPYLNGDLSPQPQRGQSTLTRKITAADGQIDWRKPVDEIARQIRACLPYPRARTDWRGHPLLILEARVTNGQLRPTFVQPANRHRMSWADFCRGQHLSESDALTELTG